MEAIDHLVGRTWRFINGAIISLIKAVIYGLILSGRNGVLFNIFE